MHQFFIFFLICTIYPTIISAEQLIFRTAADWQTWTLPAGALDITDGNLRPVFNRKFINAATQATIRGAGTNQATATTLLDGNYQTGWAPDISAPLEDWWIEIDLGQVLPVQQVRLYFDVNAAPFSFFKVSISNGERFINNANVVMDGTLLFNHSERFSFNEEHVLTIDLQDTPVRALRIEINRQTASSLLTEIELDALGDNIAFDLLAKGGSVDVQAEVVAVAGSANVMFDGDLVSAWRVNPLAKGSSGGRATFGDYRIDLGATFLLILSGS